jgi:hypothetical protein
VTNLTKTFTLGIGMLIVTSFSISGFAGRPYVHGQCKDTISGYNAELITWEDFREDSPITINKPDEVTCSIDNDKSGVPVLTCQNKLTDAFHRVEAWGCPSSQNQTMWVEIEKNKTYACRSKAGASAQSNAAPPTTPRFSAPMKFSSTGPSKSNTQDFSLDDRKCEIQVGSHYWVMNSKYFGVEGWIQILDRKGVCNLFSNDKVLICKFTDPDDASQIRFYGNTCTADKFVESPSGSGLYTCR